ncbi:hypothetical protein ACLKA7_000928 [Drosophila subpalustris]
MAHENGQMPQADILEQLAIRERQLEQLQQAYVQLQGDDRGSTIEARGHTDNILQDDPRTGKGRNKYSGAGQLGFNKSYTKATIPPRYGTTPNLQTDLRIESKFATKTNQQDPFWVDPGVSTLPEAEKLIASLMLASWPDWPISACVGCHVSPPPLYKKKVSRASFQFQVFQTTRINRKNQRENS